MMMSARWYAFVLLVFAAVFAVAPLVACRREAAPAAPGATSQSPAEPPRPPEPPRPAEPPPPPEPPPPSQPSQPSQPPKLPDEIPMFTAGPLIKDPAYTRRVYSRGGGHVTVTLARYSLTAQQYDEWVQMSAAGYPQASLDIPKGSGNGFYQCITEPSPKCSLLIQLRAGAHIEIRGDDAAPRDDIDAVARGLPLRAFAAAAPDAAAPAVAGSTPKPEKPRSRRRDRHK